jgi:predicted lipid-binding transport protein (Tim44 family)
MNSADIYTIIFLVLAVFIFFRLRSVLGTRTGNERPPSDPYSRREAAPPQPASNENVLTLPPRGETRPPAVAPHGDAPAGAAPAPGGIDAIAAADPSFDRDQFLAGARAAYEMITSAFAAGDRATLQPLLSHDVFDAFSQVIAERQSNGHKADTTLVSIDETSIGDAELRGSTAQVTVRFVAKMANAVHDADGKLIEGSPDKIVEVTDLWTFARQVDARDPNWTLVATESA